MGRHAFDRRRILRDWKDVTSRGDAPWSNLEGDVDWAQPRADRPAPVATRDEARPATPPKDAERGRVHNVKASGGYLFVAPDDGGPRLFAHFSNVVDIDEADLVPGLAVEFTTAIDRKLGKLRVKELWRADED